MDSNTGLTHAALIGLRKQSVPDAERFLSFHIAKWMLENGFQVEGTFVQVTNMDCSNHPVAGLNAYPDLEGSFMGQVMFTLSEALLVTINENLTLAPQHKHDLTPEQII